MLGFQSMLILELFIVVVAVVFFLIYLLNSEIKKLYELTNDYEKRLCELENNVKQERPAPITNRQSCFTSNDERPYGISVPCKHEEQKSSSIFAGHKPKEESKREDITEERNKTPINVQSVHKEEKIISGIKMYATGKNDGRTLKDVSKSQESTHRFEIVLPAESSKTGTFTVIDSKLKQCLESHYLKEFFEIEGNQNNSFEKQEAGEVRLLSDNNAEVIRKIKLYFK